MKKDNNKQEEALFEITGRLLKVGVPKKTTNGKYALIKVVVDDKKLRRKQNVEIKIFNGLIDYLKVKKNLEIGSTLTVIGTIQNFQGKVTFVANNLLFKK